MKIFISYAHSDEDSVRLLAERLRKGDHDVWFDERLTGGKAWKKKLLEEIQAAGCFVYALTPASVASAWCQWEFSQAVHMGKRVVPVLVKPVGEFEGVLSTLNEVQYVDFTQGDTVDFGIRLATAIFVAEIIPAEQVLLLPAPDSAEARKAEPHSNGVRADKIFDRAYELYDQGSHDEARQRLEICLSLDPGHPAAQTLLRAIEGRVGRREISPPARPDEPPDWANLLRQFRETAGFPVPEMVHIPAGAFLMGSDPKRDPDADEDEQPQISVTLPDYFMGRCPVMVGEFQVFVEAGGYADARWWTKAGWAWREECQVTRPDFWDVTELTGDPHLPVVGVSWYEATAYTRWLDGLWRAFVGTGDVSARHGMFEYGPAGPRPVFRLPTEPEWEKAARGTDGRIYPWGDDFNDSLCNVRETGIGRPSPAGLFSPGGDSPCGCADMAGNVQQWCLTAAGATYEGDFWHYVAGKRTAGPDAMDNSVEGTAYRVMRGGAWYFLPRLARCASRFRIYPGYREATAGLRVCLGWPI